MVEVSLTVGKLDASLALLLTKDHHLIEFPTILLPNGVRAGSIVKLKCDQDHESEKEEDLKFQNIQDEIYQTFATHPPKAPVLQIKNTTQTSCVLEWDTLNLGTSNLKNLILFKDGKKLGSIPQPMNNKTSKLSGLPVDKSFKFQLRLDTTAGIFWSNEVEVNTHKMTDLSGITVCLGDFSPNDPFTAEDIEETLVKIGAKHPAQHQVKVDTTHFLCTRENKQNPEYAKANDMNIPIIRPEWIKACERERRIVGVRDFYIKDCVLPDLFAKNYWGDSHKSRSSGGETATQVGAANGAAATSAIPEVTLNDTTEPIESSKSDLPPLPAKEEKEQNLENAEAAEPTITYNENDEPLEKQDTNLTKLEVDDTEISTAIPNSAQVVNETLEHVNEGDNSKKGDQDTNNEAEQVAASSEALKEGIDDAFEAVPINDESVVEVETKVTDHPVEGEVTENSEPTEAPSKDDTTDTEKQKLKEEKEANEEEKKEREAENEIKEEKFEQKEEKEELKEEREKLKKEAEEERDQHEDEKRKEETGNAENDEESVDEPTSKENTPAPAGNGGKKKKKKNKKNK